MGGARDVQDIVVDLGLIFGFGPIALLEIVQLQDQAAIAISLVVVQRGG